MTPVGVVWSLPAIQRGVILRLDGDRLRTMDECRSRHFHKQMGYCAQEKISEFHAMIRQFTRL